MRYSRLHTLAGRGHAGAWSTRASNALQWIKADLGGVKTVQAAITQGRADSNQWVLRFRIAFSLDDVTYEAVRGSSGAVQTFTGNVDRSTQMTNTFSTPLVARFVRLHPASWRNWISLRWELIGCDYGKIGLDLYCIACVRKCARRQP